MRLAAGINTYANPQGLDMTLATIEDGIDAAFVIHGRYPSYGLISPASEAQTMAVCKRHPKTVLVNYDGIEVEKRNQYLRMSKGYDFLLIIDDDERVPPEFADWPTFRENLEQAVEDCPDNQIFDVYLAATLFTSGFRPRIFYRPWTIRYWLKHYWFVLTEKNNKLLEGISDSDYIVQGITIFEDVKMRSREYANARKKYSKLLQWSEKGALLRESKHRP